MTKIKKKFTIDVKRLYLPHEIKFSCWHCNTEVTMLGENYVSYPKINSEQTINGYCPECLIDYELPVKFQMSIKYDLKNLVLLNGPD